MKFLLAILALGFVQWGTASICSQSYHQQATTQIILIGADRATPVKQSSRILSTNFKDMSVLLDDISYQFLTDWPGPCNDGKTKSLSYRMKIKGDTLKSVLDTGLTEMLFDDVHLAGTKFEFWFRFTHQPDSLPRTDEIVGKDSGATKFVRWTGTTVLKLTTTNPSSGLTKTTQSFLPYTITNLDSTTLVNTLLSTWKDKVFDTNSKGEITYQLFKTAFDSVATVVSTKYQNKSMGNAFSVTQAGKSIIIHLAKQNENMQPLYLMDMFGHQLKTIYPTGYSFIWNGNSSTENRLPSGVYFLQQGDKILGKFFYSKTE